MLAWMMLQIKLTQRIHFEKIKIIYMYNYTIIIPHKNCTNLLRRALDSIPEMDDVQIIIVDDNSDATKVDFENFPGLERKNTIVVFDKSGKGAGRARNIGLRKIANNTKWVTFLDADDFYSENVADIFKNFINNEEDVIYFYCDSVYSDTLEPSPRKHRFNKKLIQSKNNFDILKYKIHEPWCKLISYKVIKENNIFFDEVITSNDVMFSIKLGHISERISVYDEILYIVTESTDSLTKRSSFDAINCRYNVALNVNNYLNKINKYYYHVNLFGLAYKFKPIGIITMINYMIKSIKNTPGKYLFKDLSDCIKFYIK